MQTISLFHFAYEVRNPALTTQPIGIHSTSSPNILKQWAIEAPYKVDLILLEGK